MHKKGLGLGLFLAATLLVASYPLLVTTCFAQSQQQSNEETFTITTYYPSPYGSYNQLEVYRGVTYKPLSSLPASDLRQGELVYLDTNPSDSKPGQFWYYGGAGWAEQGGGQGGYFLQCGGACPSGTTKIGPAQYGTSIGGTTTRGGYNNNFSSTRSENWGNGWTPLTGGGQSDHAVICTCRCSENLFAGGSAVDCTDQYVCLTATVDEWSPGCSSYCQTNAPKRAVNNISICK